MKNPEAFLTGKCILVVDDEPDVLETMEEILNLSIIHTADNYEAACELLSMNHYHAVVLDIMGVRGYDLLKFAKKKRIPSLMLTSHALSPENLKKSVELGAGAYIPKEKMTEIVDYLAEMIETALLCKDIPCGWFTKLRSYFDREFGSGWKDKNRVFWDTFEEKCLPSQKEA